MTNTSYEIRLCDSCGLRYPLVHEHPHGTRCPVCMGGTRILLSRELIVEPSRDHPVQAHREIKKSTRGFHREETRTISVLMDNIRSAWNVGSILRSADGFGFVHAHLCGFTPTPENESVMKTSLGAEDSVPWSYHKDAVKLVRGLKKEGLRIWALEEDERAKVLNMNASHGGRHANGNMVLIIGNEVTGVDPELLDLCDEIYSIPMRGEKKSFNVAIAFGIAGYILSDMIFID